MSDGLTGTKVDGDREAEDLAGLCRAVFESTEMLVVVLDPEGRITHLNPAVERLSGYRASDLLGREIFTLLIPEDQREAVRDEFRSLTAGDFPDEYENDWITRSGERRRIHWQNTALTDQEGGIVRILGTGVDVSDQRATERSLRRNARQLRLVVDYVPALIGQIDTEYRFVFCNHAYKAWFGLDPSQVVGHHAREVLGEAAFRVLEPRFTRALSGEVAQYDGEVPYARGGTRNIHGVYVPQFDEAGTVEGCVIMAVDMSEQYRLRSALDDTYRRAQAILSTAVDAIITIDRRGIVDSFNDAAVRLFGYEPEEVVGRNVSMLMPEGYASQHDDYVARYVATGEKRIIGIGREVVARRKDGTQFPIELAVGEFEEDGEPRFTGFIRDISDRRAAEQEARDRLDELAHVTRLSSMGEMASGIAHEVNQPLAAIVTTAQALMRMMDSGRTGPDRIRQGLEQIARQGGRAGDVIHELRRFLSKAEQSRAAAEDLNERIVAILTLLQTEADEVGVAIELDLDPDLAPAYINGTQFEQVVFNLVRNALDALAEAPPADGGRIRIISEPCEDPPDCLQVRIEDNGPGIAREIREQLFEPFVTTKAHGMGQGLSICRSIVRAHGGEMECVSAEPGACFHIRLPMDGDSLEGEP